MTACCRLPPVRWLALLAGLVVVGSAHAGLRIDLQPASLSPAQVQASEQLVDDVLARLPARLREQPHLQLSLRWRDDLPAHVQGRARGTELGLDQRLLPPLTETADDSSAWEQARRALLHELAHALDRAVDGGWSSQSRFLDLAGWQQRPLWPGRGRNRFSLRSPDRYELDSPAEFFAVNFEHYLLDASYRCRRPALHAWFAQQLGAPPSAGAAGCSAELPFIRSGEQEGAAELLGLDPARVYQVDYLLAEGNAQVMSRWGHSMLRLVICAPGRVPGPACRMDLQHHLVLSFRAFVGDVQISSWRGLTGSYPSRLFVLPLHWVIDEYTKVELRGVSSTPLALGRDEIDGVVRQAAQLHWSYDGRYFFISNNCAVETWKLLQDGAPRLAGAGLQSITPTGLLKRLRRHALAAPPPADHAEAVRQGYYFESAAAHQEAVFAVARQALALPADRVEQWLALPAQARRGWMPAADGQALAALLLLEQAAWRRQELRARDLLKRRLLSGGDGDGERVQFQALMERAGLLLAPGGMGLEGYGVPSSAERVRAGQNVRESATDAAAQWRALRSQALALLPARQHGELAATQANLDYLRQRLRLRYVTPSGPAAGIAGEQAGGRFMENAVGNDDE